DLFLRPEIPVAVLYPLEIRRRDAAAVGEDVGDDHHTTFVQVFVRVWCRGTVRAFDHDPGADVRRVGHRDLILERRGDQDVDLELEELFVRERFGVTKSRDRLVLANVIGQLGDVEAFRVVDAALPVGDADDLCALFGEQLGRDSPDVPESLDGNRR